VPESGSGSGGPRFNPLSPTNLSLAHLVGYVALALSIVFVTLKLYFP
jgi:hypothetical protein